MLPIVGGKVEGVSLEFEADEAAHDDSLPVVDFGPCDQLNEGGGPECASPAAVARLTPHRKQERVLGSRSTRTLLTVRTTSERHETPQQHPESKTESHDSLGGKVVAA